MKYFSKITLFTFLFIGAVSSSANQVTLFPGDTILINNTRVSCDDSTQGGNCILQSNGVAVCGAGDCILQSNGVGVCAPSPGGKCILQSNGIAVCGAGHCILQSNGLAKCSYKPGGKCILQSNGIAVYN